ncbi:MAG TPA: hypothetical protein VHB48_05225, partial [Chitinophagaceae bacterium]|nr:hypothetical protein [Chitinophagaceae bacterium]
ISYLLMAAGVLTKGLPSVLIQALLLLCWLVYIKQWKKLFTLQHITGMLLSVAIITGYFVLYHRKNDAFVYMLQLLTESTQRSIGINKWGRVTLNVLQAPLQLLYISFPASIILFYAINNKVRQQLKGDMLFAFSCMFTLIICGIFFLSPGTANRYIYPAFPFIAIMAAIIYAKAAAVMASSKWLAGCNAIVGVFIVLGAARIAYDVWVVPYQLKTLPQNYRNLTAKILHCTNNQPVYLTGEPRPSPVNSFLLIEDEQDSTYGAPLLPYQVPYYITKATGTIMHYDSVPRRGVFYLAPVEFLKDKKVDVYFTFFDNWVRRYVALVKF